MWLSSFKNVYDFNPIAVFIKPGSCLFLTGGSLFLLWLLFGFLRRAFDFVDQSKKATFNRSVLIFLFLLNWDSCKWKHMNTSSSSNTKMNKVSRTLPEIQQLERVWSEIIIKELLDFTTV